MNFLALFAAFATLVGLTRALPQLVRLVRSGDVHGVSLDAAATTSVVSLGWTVYAVLTDQPAVAVSSGSSGVMFALVALYALRLGRTLSELKITPLWILALAVAVGFGGASALGMLLPVSVLLANGPQLRVAWREGDLSGLSLGTWVLSVVEGLAWGTYGLLMDDAAILLYGTLHTLTSSGVVALKVAKSQS